MTTDLVWACPQCSTGMVPGKPAAGTQQPLHSWHCPACEVDWVSGEALAAFVPSVSAFEKLRAAAAAAEPSVLPLHCPLCRTQSLRVVQAAGVSADICPKCVGVALDPGELSTFKSIRHNLGTRTNDTLDVISGLDALGQILKSLC